MTRKFHPFDWHIPVGQINCVRPGDTVLVEGIRHRVNTTDGNNKPVDMTPLNPFTDTLDLIAEVCDEAV